MDAIQERLEKAISSLPPNKLEQLTDYAEFLHSREEWEATQEILNDPVMRQEVDKGMEEARQGKVRPWREIKTHV